MHWLDEHKRDKQASDDAQEQRWQARRKLLDAESKRVDNMVRRLLQDLGEYYFEPRYENNKYASWHVVSPPTSGYSYMWAVGKSGDYVDPKAASSFFCTFKIHQRKVDYPQWNVCLDTDGLSKVWFVAHGRLFEEVTTSTSEEELKAVLLKALKAGPVDYDH